MDNSIESQRELAEYLRSVCLAGKSADYFKSDMIVSFDKLSEINNVSRKTPLLVAKTIFIESQHGSKKERLVIDTDKCIDDLTEPCTPEEYSISTFIQTNSLRDLTAWYLNAKSLIKNGVISYLPQIFIENEWENWYFPGCGTKEIYSLAKYKASPETTFSVNEKTFLPFLSIDLPCIEEASLENIAKLINDHPDKLLKLRNYLLEKSEEVAIAFQTEEYGLKLKKMKMEIEDNINELHSSLNTLSRTHLFETIGGIVVPWTLSIYALQTDPSGLMKIIGPGGMVAALSLGLSKFLNERYRLGRNAVDLLYRIGKSARKY